MILIVHSLPLLRRLTAVLSSALLLQLSLVSAGTRCGVGGEQARVPANPGGAAHAGMHHATTGVEAAAPANSDVSGSPERPSGSGDRSGTDKGCCSPSAPGTCASMGACSSAPSVLTSAPAVPMLADGAALAVAATAASPLGPTLAPEPPPPRA